ncbi:MAG: RagB/SusD family nutrient uptake outer membrane protein [Duncaniella sp.]|nr:RagB/SusD family nutrient uptake outer membrane protein [Duncaniella sp.]
MFKKILYSLAAVSLLATATSCNDWLDVKPNNEQITDDYWKSKEDVESVVMSGYYYMRSCVPTFIYWGELRGGTFYASSSNTAKIQDFNLTPSHSMVKYATLYQVINAANSVIKYAPQVRDIDDTYYDAQMYSHMCEAYFMRAYCNLILLKNYKSFPLILEPYVDDNASFDIAKSSEEEIVAQIKQDVLTALATGAAKSTYEEDWQTKGRATKWALYALMADVCLWSEDYETCKEYCDKILDANEAFRPVFMSNTVQWYEMFSEGNSNESIFELNWDYNKAQESNNFASLWSTVPSSSTLRFTKVAIEKIRDEITDVLNGQTNFEGRVGRMLLATCNAVNGNGAYAQSNDFYMWKYAGTEIQDVTGGIRVHNDANFILYRVSEIILDKALAETMTGNIEEAFKLVNRIRVRAGLGNFDGIADDDLGAISNIDEQTMLEEILLQKQMEFMGEAKRWYDLLWFGRVANYRYRDSFVNEVLQGNETTNQSWIRSVLMDPDAWYLPIPQDDIDHNRLLVQNPYYTTSK